ncbi:hypothetical protein, partial [Amaricoccus sp.]|uniref:hypothetical protein n=1 Tax=Amaricoccus sp. TaxID=1872485 RepID=UPI002614391F
MFAVVYFQARGASYQIRLLLRLCPRFPRPTVTKPPKAAPLSMSPPPASNAGRRAMFELHFAISRLREIVTGVPCRGM